MITGTLNTAIEELDVIRFDRKTLEKSFNDAIAKAVRASFAEGKPIYGRDRITGRPMLVYGDGRRVEIALEKPK